MALPPVDENRTPQVSDDKAKKNSRAELNKAKGTSRTSKTSGNQKKELTGKLEGLAQRSEILTKPEQKKELAGVKKEIRKISAKLLVNSAVGGRVTVKNIAKAAGILLGKEDESIKLAALQPAKKVPQKLTDVQAAARGVIFSVGDNSKALRDILNNQGANALPKVLAALKDLVNENGYSPKIVPKRIDELMIHEQNNQEGISPAQTQLFKELRDQRLVLLADLKTMWEKANP